MVAISRLISLSSTSRRRIPVKSMASSWAVSSSSSTVFSFCSSSVKPTMNSVPRPGAVETSMVPPMRSTMLLVMAMPRPVPWMPLTVLLRSRSKASNTRAANSGVIPMPLSFTRISYRHQPSGPPPISHTVTEILPPSGVNL